MKHLSDSFYGWTFVGYDTSQEAVLNYPRDEMLEFVRPLINRDLAVFSCNSIVLQRLSIPRQEFVGEVQSIVKTTPDKKVADYFNGLRRQVDFCLQDVNPAFYESIA